MKKKLIIISIILLFTNVFAQEFSSATEPALVPISANNHKLFVKLSSPFIFFDAEFYNHTSDTQFIMGFNQFHSMYNPFSGLQLSAGFNPVEQMQGFYIVSKFAMFFSTSPNSGTFLISPGVRFSFINDGIWNVFIGGNINFAIMSSVISFGPELTAGFDRKVIKNLNLGSDFGLGYLHKSFNNASSNLIFFHFDISATLYFL
jgi:hypothetical protein